ncbi:MAG TPA: cutinase family protein [Mycobacterium sp.]|nr:cutinase family protein [Mycobacterium sp.]
MSTHRFAACRIVGLVAAAVAIGCAVVAAPTASAEPCPDVEVVFARGTSEPPGVGGTGQAFVDALRSQAGPRSVDVYAVDYQASSNFAAGVDFARTVVDGIQDAGAHIEATAANCPKTRIVLGGYSQGAALAGYVTAAAIPDSVPAEFRSYIPQPMPPEIANHVAAVALFGEPSDEFMRANGVPPVVIGPLYVPKTINLCAEGDTICNGAPAGAPTMAHILYNANGMTGQAAAFAVQRL